MRSSHASNSHYAISILIHDLDQEKLNALQAKQAERKKKGKMGNIAPGALAAAGASRKKAKLDRR
jgi:hypothetical protein